jgi:hypothetical protein
LRKTKIIATLGPATASEEMLARMIEAGVNVFRLNMSHAPHDWVRRVVRDIRSAAAGRKRFVGIMLDTQGPAIRTGDLPVPLELRPGQTFTLTVRGERREEERSVDVNYENFINDILGARRLLLFLSIRPSRKTPSQHPSKSWWQKDICAQGAWWWSSAPSWPGSTLSRRFRCGSCEQRFFPRQDVASLAQFSGCPGSLGEDEGGREDDSVTIRCGLVPR